MRFQYEPILVWPGELLSDNQRVLSRFDVPFDTTLQLLDREIWKIGGREAVIQLALNDADLRRDGMPKANSRPHHPGVIVSFESIYGPLQYATDRFKRWRNYDLSWQDNLRAIALSLEALRKVDRYGVTKRGEQYTGWSALPPARPMGAATTKDDAVRLLLQYWNGQPNYVGWSHDAYREAAKKLHPDVGGDEEEFKKLQEAYDLLKGPG